MGWVPKLQHDVLGTTSWLSRVKHFNSNFFLRLCKDHVIVQVYKKILIDIYAPFALAEQNRKKFLLVLLCILRFSVMMFKCYLYIVFFSILDEHLFPCSWLQEDLRKIDNWQYINSVNLWVRFLCCNYKDYNLNPLFSQVLQVIGVAHLFPGTRYLLRLKLVQMLNELCTWSQMFFPIPSLLFDCLDFREVSQKEQTQKN